MGDRGNIVVLQDDKRADQVWLYSHWGGFEMWEQLQAALATYPGRHTDATYLTRIIHEATVPASTHRSETGHGISCRITDNEHPVLAVDVPGQQVFIIQEKQLKNGKVPAKFKPAKSWTFPEYLKLKEDPRQ